MKIAKIIIAVVLVVACGAGVFFGWAKKTDVPPSAVNPFGIAPVQKLDDWVNQSTENKAEYDLKTDSKNGWGDPKKTDSRTLDYYSIIQKVPFDAPWVEQPDNAYYAKNTILGKDIEVYAPAATGFANGVTVDQKFTVHVPETQAEIEALAEDEKIKLAVALYYYANQKYIEAPMSGFTSKAFTDNVAVGLHNRVNLDIMQINNNGEMYRVDYRWDGGIDVFQMLKTVGMTEEQVRGMLPLTVAERRYANKNMDLTYNDDGSIKDYGTLYLYADNCVVPKELTAEETAAGMKPGIPYTDWSKLSTQYINNAVYQKTAFSAKSSEVNEYNYKKNSKGKPDVPVDAQYTLYGYHKCSYNIESELLGAKTTTVKAIPEFEIVTDANGNKIIRFSIKLNLRKPRTTEDVIYTIREGSGDDKALYKGIVVKIDLWENGMYRLYGEDMKWEAKAIKIFELGSEFLYGDIYFYGPEECNIGKYVTEEEWSEAYALHSAYNPQA